MTPAFVLDLLTDYTIFTVMAFGLHIVLMSGQVSLGHAALVGVGAYASAVLMVNARLPFLLALPLSGLAGAATHGVIRTAHAVRALAARDVEIRRTELGAALAYWASRYEELPWDGTRDPEKSVAAAIARVQPRRPTLEPPPGFIVDGLRALRDTPSFAPVAGLVDVGDPARTLSEISALFAGIYLRNPDLRIHFAHTVTAPSAVRLLAPYLDDEDVESATRYAWQAAAGLYAVYHDPRSEPPADEPVTERGELVERAVANGAPHATKLVEVCLREEAIAQDPVRLRAALDAARSLTG